MRLVLLDPPPLSTKPQFEGLMTSVVFPDHDQKGGGQTATGPTREAAKMFFWQLAKEG